jgi:large subunit ribosomal protein L10
MVASFAKDIPNLEMVACVVEGQFYDAKGMQAISQIPGREVLLGRLLGSMQSPIANFARVIKQIAEKDA